MKRGAGHHALGPCTFQGAVGGQEGVSTWKRCLWFSPRALCHEAARISSSRVPASATLLALQKSLEGRRQVLPLPEDLGVSQ